MNKKILISLVIILIILIVGVVYLYINKEQTSCSDNICKFTGKISEINYGCTYDAVCYIIVDGKKVVFGSGGIPTNGSEPVWGELFGTPEVGKDAEIYAKYSNQDNIYYLSGSKDYYIKIK